MRGHRRVRVRPRILAVPVIGLLVAAVLIGPSALGGSSTSRSASAAPAARAAAPPAGAFTDGGWSLSYVADVHISGPFPGGSTGTGAGAVTGTGVFEVNGGGVSGTHVGAGTAASSITVPGGQTGPATINLALKGPVAGTTDRTVLQGDVQASGSVSVSTAGLATTVPLDFDGALGDGAGAPLTTFSVACDRVTGSWAVDLRSDGRPAAGLSVSGPATFVAIRTAQSADSAPAYTRQVTQLLADIDGVVTRVGAAPLDVNGLDTIAARAESLSSSLPEVDDCSHTVRRAGYATFLGVEVARLLTATRAQLAAVSTPDLVYLVGLGYRTAAIGSGATWSGAVPLEHALRNELDRRGAAAVAARDTTTATLVAVARRQFGVLNPATGAAKRVRAVRGVAVAPLSTPTRGRGVRPALAWAPVAGAAAYRVVLLDPGRRPYWAWQGDATSVLVGGSSKPVPAGASGPRVAKGSTWSVAAFDGSGRPLALSGPRAISP